MAVNGAVLTPAQESNILSRLDQDEDLWLVLFTLYIRSKGELIEELKNRFIDSTSEWQEDLKRTKEQGFEDIKLLITEKILQWNIRVKQLLQDPGQVTLFRLYLRSLGTLRQKRLPSNDPNSNARRQINAILSQLGGDISLNLDPYQDMTRCLDRNQTPSGKDLTDVSRNYYQTRQNDFFILITTYLGLVILLRIAASSEDLTRCQDLIRRNLIRPLELKIDSLDKSDKKDAWNRLDNYAKLIRSMDFQF